MADGPPGRGRQMKDYHGVYSALITPMKKDESVNFSIISDLIEHQLQQGVQGFYLCGTSGEALLLSIEERMDFVREVSRVVKKRVPLIAHVGTLRTKDTIRLAQEASEAEVNAISMIPPYYYKFTQKEITSYYLEVLNNTDLPVLIYNIPQFTHVAFNKENAKELLDHSQVLGVKHTSTDLYGLERIKTAYPDKVLFNGFDEMFLPALAAGADATIGTTVNVFAGLFRKVADLYEAGNMKDALEVQTAINERVELFVKHGIFNAVKYALSIKGFDCGTCRSPFSPLTDEAKKEIEGIFDSQT